MTQHIVKSFQEELDALATSIAQMGGLTEAQLSASIEAVVRRDAQLAERTIREDQRIDALEAEIESHAIRMIALRQPMAADLREAIAAIKISIDLERIGDLAKNIAKRALVLQNEFEGANKLIQGIARMGRLAQRQLKQVLDAYSNREAAAAMEVWREDEEIDAMYNSVFRELLTYMMEDPRTIGVSTHLLFIAKNIERIGDHATNIAETVGYLVTGEWVQDERPKGDTTSTTAVGAGN
ncbi:MAG: phosphate transport system regulatory protein PhoU [Alphaproteobacteria bacterium HGW-Alphaproteobacteria-11]|nr:MAG: phosphate transport system regulatory protein PhoU [Alphaproteobacteria bacterium HGW-Alphaproteobacteria-11]